MTTETIEHELVNIPNATSMELSTQSAESIMETMATADDVRTITEAYQTKGALLILKEVKKEND